MTNSSSHLDVVDLLMNDLRMIMESICESVATSDLAKRTELINVAISNMVQHVVAEEAYLYPLMQEVLPEGHHYVTKNLVDHKNIDDMMMIIEKTDPCTAEFAIHAAELEKCIMNHACIEEQVQFPVLRAKVSHEKLIELAHKVSHLKEVAAKHSEAPHGATEEQTVRAGMGLRDLLRDAIVSLSPSI